MPSLLPTKTSLTAELRGCTSGLLGPLMQSLSGSGASAVRGDTCGPHLSSTHRPAGPGVPRPLLCLLVQGCPVSGPRACPASRSRGGPSRRANGPGFTYLPARESVSAAAAAKACQPRLRPSGEGAKLVEKEAPGRGSDQQA